MLASKSALRGAARRTYATAMTSSSSSSTGNSDNDGYVSPFHEMFKNIENNTTFLGTKKPYRPPPSKKLKCGVPEDELRFMTTCYGRMHETPYIQPNEHKVTLQVPVEALPLDEKEMMVLKEIVGKRLNEKKKVLQLSSAQFGSRIENKRHAVSMLDRAVDSAKELAQRLEA